MTLFAIIQQPGPNSEKLAGAIGAAYPNDVYNLEGDSWIISDATTAQAVSEKIGITSGVNGSAIVVEIASYYGRTNPAIWTWMKSKWERSPSG